MLGISVYYYLNYFSQRNHADSKSSAWGQPLCQRKALFQNLVVQRPQLSKVQDFGFLLDKHVPWTTVGSQPVNLILQSPSSDKALTSLDISSADIKLLISSGFFYNLEVNNMYI